MKTFMPMDSSVGGNETFCRAVQPWNVDWPISVSWVAERSAASRLRQLTKPKKPMVWSVFGNDTVRKVVQYPNPRLPIAVTWVAERLAASRRLHLAKP